MHPLLPYVRRLRKEVFFWLHSRIASQSRQGEREENKRIIDSTVDDDDEKDKLIIIFYAKMFYKPKYYGN